LGDTLQQKIVANLWFNGNADEAIDYYLSVFPNSEILSTINYPNSIEEGLADFQLPLAGKTLVIEFELNGQHFTAINAGTEFTFSEAVSFAVYCKDQEEIDYYWSKLSSIPEAEQCGWCKDKFGLSWQIIPENIEELIAKPGAYARMMNMHKLVIADF
jgi:predicted 3-demethylubiquinone-9 3-methyltransferase (glyoxalase superfamily)